jgi:hypothetical protein
MKRRTVTLVIFLLFTSLAFLFPRLASSFAELRPGVEPQRRAQSGRRARRPSKPQVDYSKFNHNRPEHSRKSDPEHTWKCDSCHTILALTVKTPTGEPSGAVDVREYPKHESCLECHRQQFFKGARPVICSNCHTVVSPKSGTRFSFPKQNAKSEFALGFAHASHFKGTAQGMFKKVIGPKANIQASCVFCHKEDAREFKLAKAAAKDAPEITFAPRTFMTTPSSHATCFQCHFQKSVENRAQPPLANECAECHKPPQTAAAATTTAAAVAGVQKPTPTPVAAHATAQKPVPSPTPIVAHNVNQPWADRLAQKFPHDRAVHKERAEEKPGEVEKRVAITCTQCHAAVRKAESLEEIRDKKNHVQLPSCSSSACHTAFSGKSTIMAVSLFGELQARSKAVAKGETSNCAVCHTPPTSTSEVPCSHYVAVYNGAKKDADEQKVKFDNKREKAKTPEQIKETLDKRLQSVRDLTPQRCIEQLK